MANTKRENITNAVFDADKMEIYAVPTETFSKPVPIKNFLGDLHDLLVELGFTDTLALSENAVKKGEFVDNKSNLNRTGDMFETKYVSIKKGPVDELELNWKAKRGCPESPYGVITFEFDLTNRFMGDQEVDDGKGGKIKAKGGSWELRNKLVYVNNIKKEYLDKVPIVRNSEKLQKIYIDRFYMDRIAADLTWCQTKAKAKIYELIYGYFT